MDVDGAKIDRRTDNEPVLVLVRKLTRCADHLAKQRGAYRGRKNALSEEKADELRRRAAAGEKKAGLAREFGISRETLYQYLRQEPPPS